ncbi:hypothetical protein DFJ73DRAFT_855174 [Zopfochytrium polystomum]|nr:hypothetical protein DFJ73DRAFT_855174 [Zopfochytrium polystomum]
MDGRARTYGTASQYAERRSGSEGDGEGGRGRDETSIGPGTSGWTDITVGSTPAIVPSHDVPSTRITGAAHPSPSSSLSPLVSSENLHIHSSEQNPLSDCVTYPASDAWHRTQSACGHPRSSTSTDEERRNSLLRDHSTAPRRSFSSSLSISRTLGSSGSAKDPYRHEQQPVQRQHQFQPLGASSGSGSGSGSSNGSTSSVKRAGGLAPNHNHNAHALLFPRNPRHHGPSSRDADPSSSPASLSSSDIPISANSGSGTPAAFAASLLPISASSSNQPFHHGRHQLPALARDAPLYLSKSGSDVRASVPTSGAHSIQLFARSAGSSTAHSSNLLGPPSREVGRSKSDSLSSNSVSGLKPGECNSASALTGSAMMVLATLPFGDDGARTEKAESDMEKEAEDMDCAFAESFGAVPWAPALRGDDGAPPPASSAASISPAAASGASALASAATAALMSPTFSNELLDSVPSLKQVGDFAAGGKVESRRPSRTELQIVKELWVKLAEELKSDPELEHPDEEQQTTEPVSVRVAAAVERIRRLSGAKGASPDKTPRLSSADAAWNDRRVSIDVSVDSSGERKEVIGTTRTKTKKKRKRKKGSAAQGMRGGFDKDVGKDWDEEEDGGRNGSAWTFFCCFLPATRSTNKAVHPENTPRRLLAAE